MVEYIKLTAIVITCIYENYNNVFNSRLLLNGILFPTETYGYVFVKNGKPEL